MATNTSNSSMNDMTDFTRLPSSHCIAWVVVLIVESLLIVILNLLMVIVFATHRQLQRSGTYLLIRNLAVIDLLAGGISGPLQIERIGQHCDIWEYPVTSDPAFFLKFALLHIFSFASLGNLVAISLQRMQATFWPSRCLFLKKWVYIVIIALIWLVAAIREAAQIASLIHSNHSELEMILNSSLYISYGSIALVLISISYISIFVKIRRSPRPQQSNGVVTRERQLTSTLFIVTVVSLLTLLPVIIYVSVNSFVLSLRPYFHTRMIAVAFFLGNSLANPIIYAMKMQGVRAGLTELFTRSTSVNNAASFPLRRYRADV